MELDIKIQASSKESINRRHTKSYTVKNTVERLTINNVTPNVKALGDITRQLLQLGYSPECINLCMIKYKYHSLEQILNVLEKNEDTGKYNHQFFSVKQYNIMNKRASSFQDDNICVLCNDEKKNHHSIESLNEVSMNIESKENLTVIELLNKSDLGFSKCRIEFQNDAISNNSQNKKTEIKINEVLIDKLAKSLDEKDNLCLICFANELKEDNSYKLSCGHTFCKECLNHYLTDKITSSQVKNIKCLMAGCVIPIKESEIKKTVDDNIYSKYVKFRRRQIYLENIKKGLIPCVYPDCEEWIPYREGREPFVRCALGHEFCAICKQPPHGKKKCKNKEMERITKKNSKIKPCPRCSNLIEKVDGCNHITCNLCQYEFCWLCLKKYSNYHYSMFNLSGCPGMRFVDPKTSTMYKNPFFQCLWFFLSFIVALLTGICIIIFVCLFGACYELIKCYNNRRRKKSHSVSNSFYDQHIHNDNSTSNEQKEKKPMIVTILIYTGLILLGLSVQVFYLLFKIMEYLMECYRRYGCWFFYYGGST